MREIYKIEGLDCAHCAKKVEDHLNKSPKISHASLDFVNSKIFIDFVEPMEELDLAMYIAEVNQSAVISKNVEVDSNIKILSDKNKILLGRIIISAILTIIALCIPTKTKIWSIVQFCTYFIAYVIVSYDMVFAMFRNIFKRSNIFDENLLMSVSTIGAFVIGSYFEGVLVMLLSQVGDILQEAAVNKSRKEILKTIDLRPATANKVLKDNSIMIVDPKELEVEDTILVKMGEIVPVDGVVVDGFGVLDTSSITGEFLPREVSVGDTVVSGCILKSDSITIKVTKTYTNSTVNKILDLVSNSGANKSKAEKFITKFAKVYTPVVLAIAVVVGVVPPLFNGEWIEYIYRALIFLVISCPCAIIISVPLTYFTGLGLSAKNGIMIKGGNYLDELCKTSKILLDKTGTLTYGRFFVDRVVANDDYTENDMVECVAYAESISNHPIAKSIVEYYGKDINKNKISEKEEKAGYGVRVVYNKKEVLVGSIKWLNKFGVKTVEEMVDGSVVYVAIDSKFAGYIVLKDKVKDNAIEFISNMNKYGIDTIMLSGDVKESANTIANMLAIKDVRAELLPEDKYKILQEIKAENDRVTVFVGDGVNDAPSIISADVGIAMGAMGSDVAVDSADVVIMNDDIKKVGDAIAIANSTRRKAISNIVFSLSIKFVIMVLSMIGLSSMGLAVFADVGVMILLILNSLLLFKKKV